MKRLNFVLPEFFRLAWTSDGARNSWQSRIRAVAVAVGDLQWLSVASCMRPCGMARFTPDDLVREAPRWLKLGVQFLPLGLDAEGKPAYQSAASTRVPGQRFRVCVGFGDRESLLNLADAFRHHDDETMGKLFGYPKCCRNFFQYTWKDQGHIDTTWPMACGLETHTHAQVAEISTPSLANILLRGLGLRAVFHLPCRFDCVPTIEFADRLIDIGRKHGFEKEMDWLCEVLSWPMEWSALHGIAEIKTPIFKCLMTTDSTASLYRVTIAGSNFPEEAANGLGPAYRQPIRKLITISSSFQRAR